MTKYLLEREYTWEWWWIEHFTNRYHKQRLEADDGRASIYE